jgi:hypothetical protein
LSHYNITPGAKADELVPINAILSYVSHDQFRIGLFEQMMRDGHPLPPVAVAWRADTVCLIDGAHRARVLPPTSATRISLLKCSSCSISTMCCE